MEIYGKVEEFLSFKRIPYSVCRGLADALEKRGLNEEQILDWLSSTRIRHCIDDSLGDSLNRAITRWVNKQDIDSFKF